jgi:hypothetical protein
MKRAVSFFGLLFCLSFIAIGQANDTLQYKGQLSAWGNYNYSNNDFLFGGRYIPQLNYTYNFINNHSLDFEISANTFGTLISNSNADGDIKPYRAWVRYSSPQFEIRAGLQKINFGSATMLRPLMWFDRMDPRDPLQLTDGVWGLLGRYYFLNNANIWLWGLYGNSETKGWEVLTSKKNQPEFGGRVQIPIIIGEAALTFHHRIVDNTELADLLGLNFYQYEENRLGFDTKIDWIVGLWLEGSWTNSSKNIGVLTNQTLLNAGIDYTFGLGNGLLATYEHLILSTDINPFNFDSPINFSLLSVSYPIGLFDNINAIFYYSWENDDVYSFLNWQRTYNRLSFHLMAYWNPEIFNIPQQNLGSNMFGGKGVQIMLVFNH